MLLRDIFHQFLIFSIWKNRTQNIVPVRLVKHSLFSGVNSVHTLSVPVLPPVPKPTLVRWQNEELRRLNSVKLNEKIHTYKPWVTNFTIFLPTIQWKSLYSLNSMNKTSLRIIRKLLSAVHSTNYWNALSCAILLSFILKSIYS